MGNMEPYRMILLSLKDWEPFLKEESRLPGRRSNLELIQVAADLGTRTQFEQFLFWTPDKTPENTPETFIACCGVVGLGRLLAEGDNSLTSRLRILANDPRWRVREAVCMALQRWGRVEMDELLVEMHAWAAGSLLEQRAAAAALCEPDLLASPKDARAVLSILDHITASILNFSHRKREDFRVLRKGLGYCWSVAVAALPQEGKPLFDRWLKTADPDIRWIMRENLKKNRLIRLDAAWVAQSRKELEET